MSRKCYYPNPTIEDMKLIDENSKYNRGRKWVELFHKNKGDMVIYVTSDESFTWNYPNDHYTDPRYAHLKPVNSIIELLSIDCPKLYARYVKDNTKLGTLL